LFPGVSFQRIDAMRKSKVIALLLPEGSDASAHPERSAALLVRRADGQFALATIDARLARARRAAGAMTGKR
jgi:hypothetical protein